MKSELEKVVEELNKEVVFENEVLPSEFEFKVEKEGNLLRIYDLNENYDIDYLENENYMLRDLAEEFGKKVEFEKVDKIHEKLEKAIHKDYGKNVYLEWLTNVEMIARI